MVLATHIIFAAYGFWLPNDPRGSWSEVVRSWELECYGPATKSYIAHSQAHASHDVALRLAAKRALRYPPVQFNGQQARAIAHGFRSAIERSRLLLHACSILPEHVHVVVGRHTLTPCQIMNQLKGQASKFLTNDGIHPFQETVTPCGKRHSPWAEKGWAVFLDTPDDVIRAIRYVQENPGKEGRPPQHWSFVSEYDPQAIGISSGRRVAAALK